MDSLSNVVFGSLIHPMAALMSLPRFFDCFCLAGAEFNSHVEKGKPIKIQFNFHLCF